MNIRVTSQVQAANAIANLQKPGSKIAIYQDQISSGLRVRQASDDPRAFNSIASSRANYERYEIYKETIAESTSTLNTSVTLLRDTSSALVRAKEIAQLAISPENDATTFEALATEVDALLERTLNTANTIVDGEYLYAGTNSKTAPFRISAVDVNNKPTEITYDGTADPTKTLIGPNQSINTKYPGYSIFQDNANNVFQSLIQLRDTLRDTTLTNSEKAQALSTSLGNVDSARTHLGEAIGEQAATLSALEGLQNRIIDIQFNDASKLSELESTDYSEAVVKLKEQESLFEATLGVSARLFQPNLLEFLR